MSLSKRELVAACHRAATAMSTLESDLNAADRHLGDGDTGQTVRRLFEKIDVTAVDAPEDLGAFFRTIGRAGTSATGSSLGTLLSIALLEIGKTLAGQTTLQADKIGELFAVAEQAILSRGGAVLGDKTVADMLHAVGKALRENQSNLETVAQNAAQNAMDEFRQKPNRIGRARMYADKSVGLDDPGMLAFFHLVNALTDTTTK